MIIKHFDGNSHSISDEKLEWINVEQEVTQFGDSVKVVIIQSSDSMPHEKVMRFVEDKHVDHVFNGDSTKIIIVEHIDKNVNCNDSTKIIFIRDVATDKVIRQEIEINDNGNIRKEITIIAKVMILDIQKDDATDIKKSCVATKIDLEQKNLNVSNLQFYPNPNDGHFTLSFNLPETDKTIIRIFDTNGREIYKDTVRKFSGIYKNDIDISGNNAGVYFMQIVQNGKAITKKIGNYLGHFF